MSKPLVIYHGNCADGHAAAFAAWLKLGNGAGYLPMMYNEIPEVQDLRDLVDAREVFVLDFSLPRVGMDELFRSAKRVVWLDHHKTAFEMWCGGIPEDGVHREMFSPAGRTGGDEGWNCAHGITLNNNKSGALLAWEYFHPGIGVPMLFKHIDDYDRWQFKLEGTKEFNKALWSYTPWSFEQWKREFLPAATGGRHLTFTQTSAYSSLVKEGAAILRAHDQNVQSVVKSGARECDMGPTVGYEALFKDGHISLVGLAANCPPHLTSDVGHALATQSGTFGLCWALSNEGVVAKCSLRSNGDYDVSEIAKVFGGGGHKNAAGFEVPITTLLGWLK